LTASPDAGESDEEDRLLAAQCAEVFEEVDDSLARCQFKQALNQKPWPWHTKLTLPGRESPLEDD